MGLKKNSPKYRKISGVAFPITSLESDGTADTDASSTTIAYPWRKGRRLTFFLILQATIHASAVPFARVQVQKKSDDSWTNLLQADGSSKVEFAPAKIKDGGTYEGGCAFGSIDLNRIDTSLYKAVRLLGGNTNANALSMGAGYEITDLYETRNADGVDELESLQA